MEAWIYNTEYTYDPLVYCMAWPRCTAPCACSFASPRSPTFTRKLRREVKRYCVV